MRPKGWRILWCACALALPAVAQGPVARAYIYRDQTGGRWLGGGKSSTICLDGLENVDELARLDSRRYFYVDIAPGLHTFQLCDRPSLNPTEFKAGQTWLLRLERRGFDPKQVSDVSALQFLTSFARVAPDDVVDFTRVKFDVLKVLPPAPPPPVTLKNQEVIDMTRAGLSEWLIIRKIREPTPTAFKVTSEALIELKNAGVSEMVINAMLDAAGAVAAAAAAKK